MTRLSLTAALTLCLAPAVLAQDAPPLGAPFQMPRADEPPPGAARPYGLPEDEGGSLLEGLLNDFVTRAQPHLEGLAQDMAGLMGDYRPVLEELSRVMDDIGNYQMPPERLPNGDILIRRKPGAPPPPPLGDVPNLLPKGGPDPAPPAGGNEVTL